MILWTIRHTKPFNPSEICYGSTDLDVSDSFEEEILPILKSIRSANISQLYSSPLLRCKRLSQKLQETLKVPLEFSDNLKELHFGRWEGQKLSEIPVDEVEDWKRDLRAYRFPGGGESFKDVDKRVGAKLEELYGDKEIAWVTHAGVIASLQHSYAGVPDSNFVETQFGYAMVTRFEFSKDSSGKLSAQFETLYPGTPQSPLNI